MAFWRFLRFSLFKCISHLLNAILAFVWLSFGVHLASRRIHFGSQNAMFSQLIESKRHPNRIQIELKPNSDGMPSRIQTECEPNANRFQIEFDDYSHWLASPGPPTGHTALGVRQFYESCSWICFVYEFHSSENVAWRISLPVGASLVNSSRRKAKSITSLNLIRSLLKRRTASTRQSKQTKFSLASR